MKTQIIIIHGGDAFDTYEQYTSYLKQKETSLERLRAKDWKRNLGETLGNNYDVIMPQMPNAQNARYAEWKIWFEKIIPLLDQTVVFVGHSLGAIFLAKYLSENAYPKKIKATFLIAPPHTSATDHSLADFVIGDDLSTFSKQGGEIFFYHSKDDPVVPFSNLAEYQRALPTANVRIFENRQHFNQPVFTEIVEEIERLI